MIAKTNHKVDDFFRRKPAQVNVDRPMQQPEKEKKQEAPREEAMEFIETSSNPQLNSTQQPAEVRATGLRKVHTTEESKTEAFLTAKWTTPRRGGSRWLSRCARTRERRSYLRGDRPTCQTNSMKGTSSTSTRSTSNCLARPRTSDLRSSCKTKRRPLSNT